MAIDMTGMGRRFLPKLLGKIAIGRRSSAGWPEKLDYFIFTHPLDAKLNLAPPHKEMTEWATKFFSTDKPRTLKVVLPFHNIDEVFYTRFANYRGKKGWDCMSQDGVTATRKFDNGEKKEVPCTHSTCEWKMTDIKGKMTETCKPTGLLSVMILDAPVSGGLWRFSTRSSNSVNEILNTLQMLYQVRGSLMGLEVDLNVRLVSMDAPNGKGGVEKQNVPIVSIVLPHSWKALANGSGTVYGDFREILSAAKSSHALPNRQILDELSTSLTDEVAADAVDGEEVPPADLEGEVIAQQPQVSTPMSDDNLF